MEERHLLGLTLILVLGVAARWLACRVHLPAILLLLLCGIVAGPVTGFLQPDELFGNFLNPFVSLSVALILFEGGLSLNLRELKEIGGVVRNLILIGSLVTWAIGSVAAWAIFGLDYRLALLLGAVFVVTGPTVVIPLLRHVRPSPRVRNIIKWEGILNEPVGAILAVLVFEAILATGGGGGAQQGALQFLYSVLTGIGVGAAFAAITLVLLYFHWLPDFLDTGFTLAVVLGAFTLSDHFQPESGLLATTVMGIVLSNQRLTPVRHIVEFKEHLRVLIISTLFIVLSARLQAEDIYAVWKPTLAFLAILLFIARPASVWISCLGSKLIRNERRFLMWMAPRGIVAAAIASVFSERLTEAGVSGAEILAPIAFIVIIGTVTVYGLTALPLANRLGLAEPSPQGFLFVGAHYWARRIALELQSADFHVALAESNWEHVTAARQAGLPAYYGAVLSEGVLDEINLYGIGRLAAVTSNDEANALAALHFREDFGRSNVYQLPPQRSGSGRRGVSPEHLQGRYLFHPDLTYAKLDKIFEAGAKIKTTPITEKFTYEHFKELYGNDTISLFLINKGHELSVVAAAQPVTPKPGQTLIAIVPGDAAREVAANRAAEDASERA
ncbi:MAG: sodium:proton antiporter [Acidobacteria bacterium]|nr:sodium:proton antiporter [Acidobacteriota bacterium]MDA1236326.1 sodium:proton antiporter [Acidobacteriota bacterium]